LFFLFVPEAFAKDDCAQTSQDDECTILFEEIKKPDVPRSRRERVSLTQIVCLSSSSEDEEESDKIRVGSEYQSVVEEFANQPRTGGEFTSFIIGLFLAYTYLCWILPQTVFS
jgi:hypothetical protein